MTVSVREFVLIIEYIVVRRSRGAEEASVGLEVPIEICRMCNVGINHCASFAVAGPIRVGFIAGEKSNVMTLSDNNDSDGWLDLEFFTGSCD